MDTTPSTRYHPRTVRSFNRTSRVLNFVGLARIDLSEEGLLAEARRQTGLDRFGDQSFMPGLRVLLTAIDKEARLTPFGRLSARTHILRSLKNRLWANACFEANPEIRARKIVAPLVIIGLARSGTTRLQRMVAADGRFQHLKAWEGFNPAPRPGLPDGGAAARRAEAIEFLGARRRLNPGADAAHPMEADWAEEEILLLNHSFCGISALGFYNIPAYYRWLLGHDRSDAYRYMADLMRLVSWSRGEPEFTPWVMKTPQHMLDLDVLLKVFPDARLVFIHRDPVKTVASTLSLGWHFAVQNTDLPCRGFIRDTWLDLCEQMARRCMRGREAVPEGRQLDIYYADMNRDWRGVMRRIYGLCELEFTSAAEQGMADWLMCSESENRHGGHRYAFDDYGISAAEVDERMKFYRDEYAIPREGAAGA
ncbi:MAG: sulfotransferase [Rhodocyclaceae bacterium]|nr:sulfotransferase [Rhodocyclaceae bacterium]